MAVLQKIRDKAGLAVSIIIALALLSFIIDPGTLQNVMNATSSKYDVGQIAGKRISYADFQDDIEKFKQINEILTGSTVQNEQTQQQVRDAAWQNLIDKYLFTKKAKAAGIFVGDEEMLNLTIGDNPSAIIAGNPMFMDQEGKFSPDAVKEFVSTLSDDQSGRSKLFWDYLQNTVFVQQYYGKYSALFANSEVDNAIMTKHAVDENNSVANVDFVLAGYPMQKDSSIVISDAEVKKFYKAHKEDFRQFANRDVDFVMFEVTPSAKDIEDTRAEFTKNYEEFISTDNIKNFIVKNSDQPYSEAWYGKGEFAELSDDIENFVFSGAEYSDIFQEGNIFRAARVIASAQIPDSAYVKHILLQGADAKAKADSLLDVVKKGGDFQALVQEFSADQNSAADGHLGNIGWMTQNYMIPGFESVLTATTGQPFVLNTRYGSHVVIVSNKTAPRAKKQVAIYEKETTPSQETYNDAYSRANNFTALAGGKLEGFRKAADSLGVYAHPMDHVLESTSNYAGVENAKEVTRWIFDAKKGSVSNIITVNNNYFFVVALRNIYKEGIADIATVRPMIENKLYADKMYEAKKADVAEKIKGLASLTEIAEKLNTVVENDPDLSLSVFGSQANDPSLVGGVLGAKDGEISGPVAGEMGVYVFKVLSRQTGSFYTDSDAKNLAAQKAQYKTQQVMPEMSKLAGVKDNRARFY